MAPVRHPFFVQLHTGVRSLPKPVAGSYTVHARSCYGAGDEPTCVATSYDLTV